MDVGKQMKFLRNRTLLLLLLPCISSQSRIVAQDVFPTALEINMLHKRKGPLLKITKVIELGQSFAKGMPVLPSGDSFVKCTAAPANHQILVPF